MTRDTRTVLATWDEALDSWVADAHTARSGSDQATGPAGPAGVYVLRRPGASLSQCTMTGRVTSLWFDEHPDDDERALLALVLDAATMQELEAVAGRRPFEIGVVPVRERVDVARLAALADTIRHVALPSGGPAELLLHAEHAAVQTRLISEGHPFVRPDEAAAAGAAVDELAQRFGSSNLADRLPAGVVFDPAPVADLLRGIADDLHEPDGSESPTVALLRDSARMLDDEVLMMGAQRIAAAPVFRGPPGSPNPVRFPELFAVPPLTVIVNPDDPSEGSAALVAAIGSDGTLAPLGDLAPRQLGFAPAGGRAEVDGPWCTVTVPMDPSARHPSQRWVICRRGGVPVGAAPFTITGDHAGSNVAVAHVAVSAHPDQCAFGAHPLVRAPETASGRDLESVDRLSRAAWWARRVGHPAAGEWFAHSAVAWLGLGHVFRAGWAWSMADQQVARELLAGRAGAAGAGEAVAALEAVVGSGDLPGADALALLPTPAWVRAVDLADYARGR